MAGPVSALVSGALFEEMRLSTLSNNLANLANAGFKQDRVCFRMDTGQDSGPAAPSGNGSVADPRFWLPGHPIGMFTDFSGGRMQHTANPLDLAIGGDGFFAVETPEGTRYTRKGSFTLDSQGTVVTDEGHRLLGRSGAIRVEGGAPEIDAAGNVTVNGVAVDTIRIVAFEARGSLRKTGLGLFVPSGTDEGKPAANAAVLQGFLEGSNVEGVRSMTEMIQGLRGFESYQKMLQFLDEATGKAVNEIGRAG